MIIRRARENDAGAIAAIYAHHVEHGTASFDFEPRSAESTRTKIAECGKSGWPFLVADEGVVVGYAYATPFRDRPGYRFTCEDSIYVAPEAAGKGVGTALLSALVDAATARGFHQMIAVIGGGEPASVAIHARAGFSEAGRLHAVGHKHGRWLDSVYMQRELIASPR